MTEKKLLFKYTGGKFYVLDKIIEIYGRTGLNTVVDVFGGSGKFLLNVNAHNKIYNDIDNRLVNLFTVIKEHKDELIRKFDYILYSRYLFNKYKDEGTVNDSIEDAFRVLYLFQVSFGGKKNHFGYTVTSDSRTIINKLHILPDRINELYNDIKYWIIENLDFRDLIKKYDDEKTFFYLDPPYYNFNFHDYNFTNQDFVDLANLLKKIKGKYLLNINEDDFILKTFGEPQERIEYINNVAHNRAAVNKNSKRVELFYYNIDSKSYKEKFKAIDEYMQ